jgi:HSP20 family molecular chaperone IbpA
MPDNVDENDIKAAFNDGILHLQIKKMDEGKPFY